MHHEVTPKPSMDLRPRRRAATPSETVAANRAWWDTEADDYYAEHGDFLGDAEFVWGPEGIHEDELGLLGPVAGRDVLEIGAGAAQCSRWVQRRGGRVVATDLSAGMLHRARAIDSALAAHPGSGPGPVPLVQCDARRLPFAGTSFDTVFTAYGVFGFVADPVRVLTEVCRVLRPGGRFVASMTHPFRWAFPDEPDAAGLTVRFSYFDRTPYIEEDPDGRTGYAEHHRTLGDRIRDLVTAGLNLVDVVEPEWPQEQVATWGGWSPLRGRLVPGTLILVADKPPRG